MIKISYLAHLPPEAEIRLITDASDVAAGGTISIKFNGEWRPAGYFSKIFSEAQRNYSTYDRELLAILFSVKHFRFLLEGREFQIVTDHKPLIFAFGKAREMSPRNQRTLEFIAQFSTNIVHIPGEDNVTADCLSSAAVD